MIYGLDDNGKAIPSRANSKGDIFNSPLLHNVYTLSDVTRLLKFGAVDGTTLTIYTVPVGKVAYITSFYLGIQNAAAAVWYGDMRVLDQGGVEVCRWRIGAAAGAGNVASFSFSVPIRLTAGEQVALYSVIALCYIRGTFTGYELSA